MDHGRSFSASRPAIAPDGLAHDWPGLKLGAESISIEPGADGASALRSWRAGLWIEPASLRAWALGVLARSPHMSSRMPKLGDDLASLLPSLKERPAPTLGTAQALCAALWLLHPLYELFDQSEEAHPTGRLSPKHTLQLPWSPADGDDPGSEGYIRAGFFFLRPEGSAPALVESAREAALASFGAATRVGRLDSATWREEVRVEDAASAGSPRWHGMWEMELLDSFRPLWAQIDIALAVGSPGAAGPGPTRL